MSETVERVIARKMPGKNPFYMVDYCSCRLKAKMEDLKRFFDSIGVLVEVEEIGG